MIATRLHFYDEVLNRFFELETLGWQPLCRLKLNVPRLKPVISLRLFRNDLT